MTLQEHFELEFQKRANSFENKLPENIPGKYYVYNQPKNQTEERQCMIAKKGCPAEAIIS